MKSYEWWLKQKQRVRKKYLLFGSKYYSPKEVKKIANSEWFKKRLKNLEKQNEDPGGRHCCACA